MADDQYDSANIQSHPAFTGAADEAATFSENYDKLFKSGGGELPAERVEREFNESRESAKTPETAEADPPQAEVAEQPVSRPDDPLIFGKYKSLGDAEKAYWEAVRYANTAMDERNALMRQSQPAAPEVDPVKALEEYGVPSEVARPAMEAVAQQAVERMLMPFIEDARAEQAFAREHEEYVMKKNDFERFLMANPDINQGVESARAAGQYGLARDWAWLKFQQTQVKQVEQVATEAAQERKRVVEEAKKDAGVGTRRNDSRAPKDNSLSQEEFERLAKMAKDGHSSLLWRHTIGNKLPDELFQ